MKRLGMRRHLIDLINNRRRDRRNRTKWNHNRGSEPVTIMKLDRRMNREKKSRLNRHRRGRDNQGRLRRRR